MRDISPPYIPVDSPDHEVEFEAGQVLDWCATHNEAWYNETGCLYVDEVQWGLKMVWRIRECLKTRVKMVEVER